MNILTLSVNVMPWVCVKAPGRGIGSCARVVGAKRTEGHAGRTWRIDIGTCIRQCAYRYRDGPRLSTKCTDRTGSGGVGAQGINVISSRGRVARRPPTIGLVGPVVTRGLGCHCITIDIMTRVCIKTGRLSRFWLVSSVVARVLIIRTVVPNIISWIRLHAHCLASKPLVSPHAAGRLSRSSKTRNIVSS